MSKFESVPLEEDVTMITQLDTNFGEYDVRYEKWSWDGIVAESLIFLTEDIANITDSEIIEQIRNSTLSPKSDEKIKRGEEFTFVNFNFNFIAD